jgi:uncharacterized protein (TIGR02118 family)
MISIMTLMKTNSELTDDIMTEAAPDMAQPIDPNGPVLGCVFNRVSDRSQKGITYARSDIEFDAIGQFFCRDISSGMTAAGEGVLDMTMGVPSDVVDAVDLILCLQNTVVEPPKDGSCLKRMSILRKRPDVSAEFFQEQWFELHAILVKRLPGLKGYRQNLVLDGPRNAQGEMMVDGMVELWFEDGAAIDAAFGSDIGNTTMMHAKEFIAEISTFLVEPYCESGLS